MWAEYFIIFGVLFALYCVVRLAIWWEILSRPHFDLRPLSKPYSGFVTLINASPLLDRVEQVRQDCLTHAHGESPSFKKAFLVESRREELSHHSYFHKPPPPPPQTPEDEGGL